MVVLSMMLITLELLAHAQRVPGDLPWEFKSYPTHSRLVFHLPPGSPASVSSEVSIKNHPDKGFEIVVAGANLNDLGAPFGGEADWLKRVRSWAPPAQNSRLAGLDLEENASGVVIRGKWKFARGPRAPADSKMESFDFWEEGHERLVLDFWQKPGPTLAELLKRNQLQRKLASLRDAEKKSAARESKAQAALDRKRQASVVTDYCEAPHSDATDVYLPFRPFHPQFDLSKWFPGETPDHDFRYRGTEGASGEDARYLKLALELNQSAKSGLVVRTIEFLEEEFPGSPYLQEGKFLKANSLLRLGLEAKALPILNDLAVEAKGTPVAFAAKVFLATTAYKRGEYLGALEHFTTLAREYPTHPKAWVFHLAAAECLYNQRQTEQAEKEYEIVVRTAPEVYYQAQAAYQIGDLFLERRKYPQALAAYYQASEVYKTLGAQFPNVSLNRGESLYWLGQYSEAETEFRNFLKTFPSHSAGWIASIRIGEILDRSTDAKTRSEAKTFYLRAVNQYPTSSGVTLARLRLLPCEDHGGLSFEAMERFLKEEAQKSQWPEIVTDNYVDLKRLAELRALVAFQKPEIALERSVEAFKRDMSAQARGMVQPMLQRAFRNKIIDLARAGEPHRALGFYQKLRATIVIEPGQIPGDFLLALASAALELELGGVASKLIEEAKRFPDVIDDASHLALLEAQALWMTQGAPAATRVTDLLSRVTDDTPGIVEREMIGSQVAETNKDIPKAIAHLQRALLLDPSRKETLLRRLQVLYVRLGNEPTLAASLLREGRLAAARSPASSARSGESFESLALEAAQLEKLNRWKDAQELYELALKQGDARNQTTYLLARSLEKQGGEDNLKRARELYDKISKAEKSDFWKKLAQEALAQRNRTLAGVHDQGGEDGN